MKNRLLTVGVALGLLAVTVPGEAAKLYRWVDDKGNVSYQDRPPPEGAGKVEEKTIRSGDRYRTESEQSDPGRKQPVTLYMVQKCSPCDAARAYLKERQVPFTEVDVGNDIKNQEALKAKAGDLSVPTITVGSRVMKGFLESILETELEQGGYPKAAESESEAQNPQ